MKPLFLSLCFLIAAQFLFAQMSARVLQDAFKQMNENEKYAVISNALYNREKFLFQGASQPESDVDPVLNPYSTVQGVAKPVVLNLVPSAYTRKDSLLLIMCDYYLKQFIALAKTKPVYAQYSEAQIRSAVEEAERQKKIYTLAEKAEYRKTIYLTLSKS
jgi:hypothetical protein